MNGKIIGLSLGLLLAACAGLTIQQIVGQIEANAKAACGVIINVEQMLQALTGLDPTKLSVVALVNSICAQVQVLEAQNPSPTPRKTTSPIGLPTEVPVPTGATKCWYVMINGQPVQACK